MPQTLPIFENSVYLTFCLCVVNYQFILINLVILPLIFLSLSLSLPHSLPLIVLFTIVSLSVFVNGLYFIIICPFIFFSLSIFYFVNGLYFIIICPFIFFSLSIFILSHRFLSHLSLVFLSELYFLIYVRSTMEHFI